MSRCHGVLGNHSRRCLAWLIILVILLPGCANRNVPPMGFGGKPFKPAADERRIWAQAEKEEEKIVYIKSGIEVQYGEVVKVINAVREKGIDKIGLVADKKKKSGAAQAPAPAPAT